MVVSDMAVEHTDEMVVGILTVTTVESNLVLFINTGYQEEGPRDNSVQGENEEENLIMF